MARELVEQPSRIAAPDPRQPISASRDDPISVGAEVEARDLAGMPQPIPGLAARYGDDTRLPTRDERGLPPVRADDYSNGRLAHAPERPEEIARACRPDVPYPVPDSDDEASGRRSVDDSGRPEVAALGSVGGMDPAVPRAVQDEHGVDGDVAFRAYLAREDASAAHRIDDPREPVVRGERKPASVGRHVDRANRAACPEEVASLGCQQRSAKCVFRGRCRRGPCGLRREQQAEFRVLLELPDGRCVELARIRLAGALVGVRALDEREGCGHHDHGEHGCAEG